MSGIHLIPSRLRHINAACTARTLLRTALAPNSKLLPPLAANKNNSQCASRWFCTARPVTGDPGSRNHMSTNKQTVYTANAYYCSTNNNNNNNTVLFRCATTAADSSADLTTPENNPVTVSDAAPPVPDAYPVLESRLKQMARSPSNWAPAMEPLPQYPFWFKRNRNKNMPVYIKYKNGGTTPVTVVTRVFGDLNEFEKCIRWKLGDKTTYRQDAIGMKLWMDGEHKDEVAYWLMQLGF